MSKDDIQTGSQSENLRSLFAEFDKDGDGKIRSSEVVLALQNHHEKLSQEEIGYMMRFFDLNKDDVVHFSEFVKMANMFEKNQKMSEEEQIRQLFRAADKNKDGVLSPEELKKLWNLAPSDETTNQLTENEMDDMISSIDTNEDGRIDYEEFLRMLS